MSRFSNCLVFGWCCGLLASAWGVGCLAAEGPAITDAAKAEPDFAIQGEYVGKAEIDGREVKIGLQVIALGNDEFEANAYHGGLPGDGWDEKQPKQGKGKLADGKTTFTTDGGTMTIQDGVANFVTDDANKPKFSFKKVERKSPTLGAEPPKGAVVLFDGKTKDHWKGGSITDDGLLATNPGGNISGKDEFADFTLHLEFRTPYMPQARGQGRGNSGVYLQNRYELQVLDSFGLKGENNECGGFYQIAGPSVNMCLPPLAWQTYDIEMTGAKFNDKGEKSANAVVTVKHNGVTIHDKLEFKNVTPGGVGKESPGRGPFFLQDHGNPVHFRNIWVVEKK